MERYQVSVDEVDGSEFPIEEFRHLFEGTRFIREQWTTPDGLVHRNHGPAVTLYDIGGVRQQIATFWFKEGNLHRDDQEACHFREPNYGANYRAWFKEGMFHRDDGAALTVEQFGVVPQERYFLHGIEQSEPILNPRHERIAARLAAARLPSPDISS